MYPYEPYNSGGNASAYDANGAPCAPETQWPVADVPQPCGPGPCPCPAPPWESMPTGGEPFDRRATIDTPGSCAAVAVILSFRVPTGSDGVIKSYGNFVSGSSFGSGSGELQWQLLVNASVVREYGNILHVSCDSGDDRIIHGGILIYSEDRIVFRIDNISLVGAQTRAYGALSGWYWPRADQQRWALPLQERGGKWRGV